MEAQVQSSFLAILVPGHTYIADWQDQSSDPKPETSVLNRKWQDARLKESSLLQNAPATCLVRLNEI